MLVCTSLWFVYVRSVVGRTVQNCTYYFANGIPCPVEVWQINQFPIALEIKYRLSKTTHGCQGLDRCVRFVLVSMREACCCAVGRRSLLTFQRLIGIWKLTMSRTATTMTQARDADGMNLKRGVSTPRASSTRAAETPHHAPVSQTAWRSLVNSIDDGYLRGVFQGSPAQYSLVKLHRSGPFVFVGNSSKDKDLTPLWMLTVSCSNLYPTILLFLTDEGNFYLH